MINFVYPTCVPRLTQVSSMIAGHRFLFMVLPVFIARSTDYMNAIQAATGVFFAIGWDAESEGEDFKPDDDDDDDDLEQEPNRSEA